LESLDFIKHPFTSFIFSILLLPVLIKILEKHQILDIPGQDKIHSRQVASMGGIAVFLGLLFTILLWWSSDLITEYRLLIAAVVLMFIIGLKDDLLPLKPWQKLVSQIIPVVVILFSTDGLISSLYGLFGIHELSSFISIPLTMFTIVVIVNSINLIDGADGLAGAIGFLIISALGLWFYLAGSSDLAIISWSFSGALLAFLLYNWQPAKIFMGDTGALITGLIAAFLIIRFLNTNYTLPAENAWKVNGITASLCLLFVPLFDTLRVFILRIIHKKSPFSSDKNHIHHILIRLGFSHAQLTLFLIFVTILAISMAVALSYFSEEISLFITTFIALMLNLIVEYLNRRVSHTGIDNKQDTLKIIESAA